VSSQLTRADRLGAVRVRLGIGRGDDGYKVDPGLYALGEPDPTSPVLVTANYKLTFDALRSSVGALDAWILVLDTRGINVWCAAGKHTFSTDEVVRQLQGARLGDLLAHNRLILPQLGATGVAAHEVRRQSGFRVVYGPVRASDVPAFLAAGMKATPEMREPKFGLLDRLVLAPVELTGSRRPAAWMLAGVLLFAIVSTRPLTAGAVGLALLRDAAPFLLGLLGGAVLTPALLPWLPARAFAAKGALVGVALAAVLAIAARTGVLAGSADMLIAGAIGSYAAMNFTGSSPFTSMSGVEREMRVWLPLQAGAGAVGLALFVLKGFLR
jgi:hypothetical protein